MTVVIMNTFPKIHIYDLIMSFQLLFMFIINLVFELYIYINEQSYFFIGIVTKLKFSFFSGLIGVKFLIDKF